MRTALNGLNKVNTQNLHCLYSNHCSHTNVIDFAEGERLLAILSVLRFDHRPPRQHFRLVLILSLRSNAPLTNVHIKIPISRNLISRVFMGTCVPL